MGRRHRRFRSGSAALSTSSRSACLKYTKIFWSGSSHPASRPECNPFFIAAMAHRRNGDRNHTVSTPFFEAAIKNRGAKMLIPRPESPSPF